jgi:hypothetical protein
MHRVRSGGSGRTSIGGGGSDGDGVTGSRSLLLRHF